MYIPIYTVSTIMTKSVIYWLSNFQMRLRYLRTEIFNSIKRKWWFAATLWELIKAEQKFYRRGLIAARSKFYESLLRKEAIFIWTIYRGRQLTYIWLIRLHTSGSVRFWFTIVLVTVSKYVCEAFHKS